MSGRWRVVIEWVIFFAALSFGVWLAFRSYDASAHKHPLSFYCNCNTTEVWA